MQGNPARPDEAPLRVAFAGTPEFAAEALRAILAAGFPVPLVLTQPDRPAGRGMRLRPGPVKQVALDAELPLLQPRGLRVDGRYADDAGEAHRALAEAQPDVLVVAAYGLILPQSVLDLPRFGCLNIHASLLPRWRGAAPIQRAIEAGDAQTGISLMQMDAGLDTGPVLLEQPLDIAGDDTASTLHDKLARLGGELVVLGLHALSAGRLQPRPQPVEGVTYAQKIAKSESWIDWDAPSESIARRVRAFSPWPGAQFESPGGEIVKVGAAHAVDPAEAVRGGVAGQVLRVGAEGIDERCGSGVLRLTQLQRPGGTMQPASRWAQSARVAPGSVIPRRTV